MNFFSWGVGVERGLVLGEVYIEQLVHLFRQTYGESKLLRARWHMEIMTFLLTGVGDQEP